MAIYMKIDGIDGDVTAKGHEKWIKLSSFSWGASNGARDGATVAGNASNRGTTKPNIKKITVAKELGPDSPNIIKTLWQCKPKEIEIHMCSTGDEVESHTEYKLSNAFLIEYDIGTQQGTVDASMPWETISFNFDKIEIKHIPRGADNKAESPIPVSYDLKTATAA